MKAKYAKWPGMYFKRYNMRRDLSSLPLKLKTAVFQNLPVTACFWGTQHDTAVTGVSLNHTAVVLSEFNFSAVVFIQVKEYEREVGLSFLKQDLPANWASGGLWMQNGLLVTPFPMPCAFGLHFLHRSLCDLVLLLDWIIWLVSHPAQPLPVWPVVL